MVYSHKSHQNETINLPSGKIVCVGRNYLDHAKELNNPIPSAPLLFMKPASSLVHMTDGGSIHFPKDKGACHFETEVALLIGKNIDSTSTEQQLQQAIWGYALALDLTLRDLQSELKAKSHPWEKAKCFDGACPMTHFIPADELPQAPEKILYHLNRNHTRQQNGDTQHMITPIVALLQYMTEHFTLHAGDIVLTGTPAGVGKLNTGDILELSLEDKLKVVVNVE